MPPDVDVLFSQALARAASDMLGDLGSEALAIGGTISHYRIVERIGEGGMGVVYKAEDTRLGRFVAIKTLPPAFQADRRLREGFEREARAASALNHPAICTVYDFGEHEGARFIVMEYLDGETLRDRTARAPLVERDAIDIALQVCAGLDAAHRARIVHCDIKPANIFLCREGQVKVLDFGTARLRADTASVSHFDLSSATLANPAMLAGTRDYMSPEQERGLDLDRRTDIYSLGMVLRTLSSDRSSAGWTRLVRHMTEAERRNRVRSIEEVAAALTVIQKRDASRALRVASLVIGAALVAAVTFWLLR